METTTTVRIGDTIPDLELKAYYQDDEKLLKVKDYKKQWKIFFFYPADFTFVCPTELEELADMYELFKKEAVAPLALDDLSIEGIELSFAMNFVLVEFACV
jgi:peroxiredoxin (alkyl hydroperoxide reductase subunit C)